MTLSWDPVVAMPAAAPGQPRSDAYLAWFELGQPRADAGTSDDGEDWVWLLLELRAGTTVPAFAGRARALDAALQRAGRADGLRVPAHYEEANGALAHSRFCTAIASRAVLAGLCGRLEPGLAMIGPALAALCRDIVRFEIGAAAPPWPQVESAAVPSRPSRRAGSAEVVVGVIDDGLAFAHRRFCVDDGLDRRTRLLSLWDQDAASPLATPWAYGRTHQACAIDSYLLGARTAWGLDEDQAYRLSGYRAVRHAITHGTHVMDLACGAGPDRAAGAAAIVGVQLPAAALEDTSCASMEGFMVDGVRHVLDAAARHGVPGRRVVVNLSLGNTAGPHDGSSVFERALDELVSLTGCRIVLPAGNSHLSRGHYWSRVETAGVASIPWKLQPQDGTPSYLEMWLSVSGRRAAATRAVTLRVQPPGGAPPSPIVHVGQGVVLRDGRGRAVAQLSFHAHCANGNRPLALLALAPTCPVDGVLGVAPPGCWTVQVANTGPAFELHADVQRDDRAFGHKSQGRQSVLLDPDYRRFDDQGRVEERDSSDAYVRRPGSHNGLACGARVDVASGAQRRPDGEGQSAPYSAVGISSRPSRREALHVFAVTEDSRLLHGVTAAGTRSGAVARLSGTSMAAPQLTRWIAARVGQGPAFPGGRPIADHLETQRQQVPMDADLAARSARRRD